MIGDSPSLFPSAECQVSSSDPGYQSVHLEKHKIFDSPEAHCLLLEPGQRLPCAN